jgi:SAM-dependent MidA family methyltransferase
VNDKTNTDNLSLFRDRFQQAVLDSTTLPAANNEELNRSRELSVLIARRIDERGGLISFADFMDAALYEPALGYYTATNNIFGAEGDFLTAPEISDLFGICIARQCMQVLSEIEAANLLEIGAGSGVLATTILNELAEHNALPDKYFILERSEALRNKQQKEIEKNASQHAHCVQWISQLPKKFTGVIIGNEVLDALPVKIFITSDNKFFELGVANQNDEFIWAQGEVQSLATERLSELSLPSGYVSEINPAAEKFTKEIAACLDKGAAFLFDYGYPRTEFYLPDRSDGSLMCYYRHRTHGNPFALIGLQDITSFIDFTAIAEAAVSAGADVLGYTSQAGFLMAMGLDQIMAEKTDPEKNVKEHLQMTQAVKKLTLPHEMGELIKVIALGKNIDVPLQGFSLQDRRHRL